MRAPSDRDGEAGAPIFAVEGGPGYASTRHRERLREALRRAARAPRLVLVDMRGTGRSEPVRCPDLQRGARPRVDRAVGVRAAARRRLRPTHRPPPPTTSTPSARRSDYGGSRSTATPTAPTSASRTRSATRDGSTRSCSTAPTRSRGESPWYPSLITTGIRALEIACERSPNCPAGAGERLLERLASTAGDGRDVGPLIDALAGAAYGPPRSYLQSTAAGRELLAGDPRRWRR